jgi:hypothetical protein
MATFPLETKNIIMTLENVKLNDLNQDSSPTVLRPNDQFELSVDVVFTPNSEPLLKCLMESGLEIQAFFGIETIGPGDEVQLIQKVKTMPGVFKYTIKTDPSNALNLKLSTNNTIYLFAVAVLLKCSNTNESLISGFEDGPKFLVATS